MELLGNRLAWSDQAHIRAFDQLVTMAGGLFELVGSHDFHQAALHSDRKPTSSKLNSAMSSECAKRCFRLWCAFYALVRYDGSLGADICTSSEPRGA